MRRDHHRESATGGTGHLDQPVQTRLVAEPKRIASCNASTSTACWPDSLASSAASKARSIVALTFPSAAASHDSAILSCGPNTATCRPNRVRNSATILAPASARPSTQYDCASGSLAGKLQDAGGSEVNAATVCSIHGLYLFNVSCFVEKAVELVLGSAGAGFGAGGGYVAL